jgi:hypothetical protein
MIISIPLFRFVRNRFAIFSALGYDSTVISEETEVTALEKIFEEMTPSWFNRATFYTGSVHQDFRFRYEQDPDKEHPLLHAATYSKVCYELADDVERQDFSWDEAGVDALKQWYQSQYERYTAAHAES